MSSVSESRLAHHLQTAKPWAYCALDVLRTQAGPKQHWARRATMLGFQLSSRAVVAERPDPEWQRYWEELTGERLEMRSLSEIGSRPEVYFPMARTTGLDRSLQNVDTFLSCWDDERFAAALDKTTLPQIFGREAVLAGLPLVEALGRSSLRFGTSFETSDVLVRVPASTQGHGMLRTTLAKLTESGVAGVRAHPAFAGLKEAQLLVYPFLSDREVNAHLEIIVSMIDGRLDFVEPLVQVTRKLRKFGSRSCRLSSDLTAKVMDAAESARRYVTAQGLHTTVFGFDAAALTDNSLVIYDFNPCLSQGIWSLLNAVRLRKSHFRSALLVIDQVVPFEELRDILCDPHGERAVILAYSRNALGGTGNTACFINAFGANAQECDRSMLEVATVLSSKGRVLEVYY